LEPLAVSLAQHYMAAGDAARAVPYLCRAGDDASRRVALEEAIQFYESALELWQENDVTARAEVLHKLGVTHLALGNSIKAIDRLSEADQLYAQVGNRTGMGAVQRLIGRSYYEQGERARAMDHYHKALSLLEHEPENPELARAISALAQMHMSQDEYDEAIAWGERAISLARAPDTEDIILHALTSVGTSWVAKGEAERGLAMLAKSLERAEALGLPHDAGRAYAGWTDSLVSLERYEEARALYESMLAYAQKVHASMFEGVAMVQLGYLDWWAGQWRQAWARRQAIMDWMATFPGASFAKVWASNFLGLIYNDLGQPEKAGAILSGVYSGCPQRSRTSNHCSPPCAIGPLCSIRVTNGRIDARNHISDRIYRLPTVRNPAGSASGMFLVGANPQGRSCWAASVGKGP
jgi:tetratricopeptide (TPR) repeat protein